MAWKYSMVVKVTGTGKKFIEAQLESLGYTIVDSWNAGFITTTQLTSQHKNSLRTALATFFEEEQV